MSVYRLVVVLAIGVILQACASTPSSRVGTEQFISQQKQTAAKLEAQGKTYEALVHWQSIAPLGADAETKAAIRRLNTKLDQEVAANLRSARDAYASGRSQRGDTLMLKVLADRPGQKEALKRLGESYAKKAQAQQANKSAQETAVMEPTPTKPAVTSAVTMQRLYDKGDFAAVVALGEKSATKGNHEAEKLMRDAYVGLADTAERAGKKELALTELQKAIQAAPEPDKALESRVAALKESIAEQWYAKGVRQMKSDLPAAITSLQKAIEIDSSHMDARRKLSQAQTLQRNLDKIEKSR